MKQDNHSNVLTPQTKVQGWSGWSQPQLETSRDSAIHHERGVRNVILVYIRVSVVLIWSLCRKEREKLDITLDSTVFVFRVKEI